MTERTDEMLKRDRRSGCGGCQSQRDRAQAQSGCRWREAETHPLAADAVEEPSREREDLDGADLRPIEVLDDERELAQDLGQRSARETTRPCRQEGGS